MEENIKVLEKVKGEIPVMSLDSTIEHIFYEKCMEKSKRIPVLLEWANSKKIYCGHTNLISSMYGNYSCHDCTHSVAILEGIAAVIGKKRIANMDIMDLWLLLHCAYAHDMGMPYSYSEAIELWGEAKSNSEFKIFLDECRISDDKDVCQAIDFIDAITQRIIPGRSAHEINKKLVKEFSADWPVRVQRYYTYLTSEYCRRKHASRTRELLERNLIQKKHLSPYNVEDRLYKLVGLCSEMHGKDFSDLLKMEKKEWTQLGYCHPPFIAALLRLGDLLDIDNKRFDSIVLEYYGDLNKISAIHKKKHESITHIDYEINKIEITAESDDEDVCRCANDWFAYLDSEVKNIIFHWAKIAPESVGGCQFSIPETKVYLKGQLFREISNHEFQVNKEMLIKLVIGRNLYNSKLDFIREYLQNALDAVKMKLWLELKDEQNAHYIKEDHFDIWKKGDKASVNPFFFNKYIYENYRIDVICEWDNEDKDNPCVVITINDRGIGIDEECVDAISHIGSGWKRRKKYREDLERMPAWLRPTGGFGIGMQSGFMVAEVIRISTKCEDEVDGREIVLHSSSSSGKIEEKRIAKKRKGTSVSVSIPYEWFLEDKNFSFYNLKASNELKDYFSPPAIMDGVYTIVKGYIETIASNTIFPIYVSRKGFSAHSVGTGILKDLKMKTVKVDDITYEVYSSEKENVVYIWEKSRAVLCKIEPDHSFDEAHLVWAYKGMRVWPEISDTEDVAARSVGSVSIDIMGIDVEKCLTVDRSKFALEFDHFSLLLQLLKAYINSFRSVSELFDVDISSPKNVFHDFSKEDCYKILLCKRLLKNGEERKKISKFLQNIKENNANLMISMSLLLQSVSRPNAESSFEQDKWLLPYYCKKFWLNMDRNILVCEKEIDFSRIDIPMELLAEYTRVIIDPAVYAIMGMYTNDFVVLDKELDVKCLYNQYKKGNMEEEKSSIFGNNLNWSGRQQIYYTNKFYNELWVSAIPFMSESEYQKQLSSDKKAIISPVSPSESEKVLIKRAIEGKENTMECFRKYIMDNDRFKYLIDWVAGHQFIPDKYTREQIEDSYKKLIDFIYTNEVQKILTDVNGR